MVDTVVVVGGGAVVPARSLTIVVLSVSVDVEVMRLMIVVVGVVVALAAVKCETVLVFVTVLRTVEVVVGVGMFKQEQAEEMALEASAVRAGGTVLVAAFELLGDAAAAERFSTSDICPPSITADERLSRFLLSGFDVAVHMDVVPVLHTSKLQNMQVSW